MKRAIGTMALCAAFLACASPAPAQAARPPKGKLKIVVAVKGSPTKGVTLRCSPDGGTHPHPKAACDVLRTYKGDLNGMHVPKANSCGPEVQPYAVVVKGTWNGKKVEWSKGYRNACVMKAAGGALLS
ncbi:SSI family serine proteinase inhibitor [Actinomadura sp. ATCC 31491]|uniref:SSI family serine proteinase inhibitor n=1 Tax=Actinomadura luzonensis TaxID=2805427 RepID=A0ABT0FYS2_9ACTN|nr:SSI family serine proteinase inhibitor [Actinomadura luzonensis]MCK2217496.1 SSI family serine proteinase inhibitor [Actinomadura luzonensis]